MSKAFFLLTCVLAANAREVFYKGLPKMNPISLLQYGGNPFENHYGAFMPTSMDTGSSFRNNNFGKSVMNQVRMQSAVMAEKYLRSSRDIKCTQKTFCNVAAHSNTFDNDKATLSSVNVLNQMLKEVQDYSDRFPHISGLVAAFAVGSQTRNTTLCQWLFHCPKEVTQQGRVNCRAASSLCPGISISCALCAMVAPDTCGVVCPVAALYCGTSGYACMGKGDPEDPPKEEEIPVEEDNDAPEEIQTGQDGEEMEEDDPEDMMKDDIRRHHH